MKRKFCLVLALVIVYGLVLAGPATAAQIEVSLETDLMQPQAYSVGDVVYYVLTVKNPSSFKSSIDLKMFYPNGQEAINQGVDLEPGQIKTFRDNLFYQVAQSDVGPDKLFSCVFITGVDQNKGRINGILTKSIMLFYNDPPVAINDSAVTKPGQEVIIPVLDNDSDPNDDVISVIDATYPANGEAIINSDGTITYQPEEGFTGQDSFSYTIQDEHGLTDSAIVSITVQDGEIVNDPPVAINDSAVTKPGQEVIIPVLDNDSDPNDDVISVIDATYPANGEAIINSDGTITYQPEEGFTGQDSFIYTIQDEHGLTDSAQVTVTVSSEEQPSVGTGTIGYWKNHSDEITLPLWLGTVDGTKSVKVDTTEKAIEVLEMRIGRPSNGITKLYAQLLAAKLSISSGSDDDVVEDIIAAADDLLAKYDNTDWDSKTAMTEEEKSFVTDYMTTLERYNSGEIGPGHR